MSFVRTHVCLMDVLLYKLYTEKSDIAIDEIYVFIYSNEVFKLSASSCVWFVDHLTTRFYGFTTLTISTDEIWCDGWPTTFHLGTSD